MWWDRGSWTCVFLCVHDRLILYSLPPWRYFWGWMGTYCRTRTSIQWIPACHGAVARDWGRGSMQPVLWSGIRQCGTPWKTWSPKNGGLEDYFPFQLGTFLGSVLIFTGCRWNPVHVLLELYELCSSDFDLIWTVKFSKRSRLVSRRCLDVHLGVSKNRGTPKWMVYNGKPY